MSVLRLNEFTALPGKFEKLTALFANIVTRIQAAPGCLRCDLLIKVADGASNDEKLFVVEVWESVAAHKASLAGMKPLDFAPVMELLATRTPGQYFTAIEG